MNREKEAKKFRDNIKRSGMNLATASEYLGVHRQTLWNYRNGSIPIPKSISFMLENYVRTVRNETR